MTHWTTRTLGVRFLTPAFLGDAGQNGRWRTPPFKHLLREWWRVAWVADGNDARQWPQMREEEGRLFGHAWLDPRKGEDCVSARRSRVRLRLEPWSSGQLKNMPRTKPVSDGRNAVASHLYLGYGPVKSASELKMNHPIDPGRDKGTLALAWPEGCEGAKQMEAVLALIHAFGTVGGRARNGWGSVALMQGGQAPILEDIGRFVRPWRNCLEQQWAHAIGADEQGQPLIWLTQAQREWKGVIEDLASIRKSVNGLARTMRCRDSISQPVGGKGDRVPSNLRFKVRQDEDGRYYGVVFHMPFLPPAVNSRAAEEVWQAIHELLDERLERGQA